MEFPQIPTDSLYKFMALSGLAMVVLFIVFPGQKLSEIAKQSIAVQGEYKVFCVESDELTKELKRILANADKLTAEYNQQIRTKDMSAATEKRLDAMNEKLKSDESRANEKGLQLSIAKIKSDAKSDELKANGEFFRATLWILRIGFVIGGMMASVGFVLWYTRIQVLQDKLLARQVESLAPSPPLTPDAIT